ncbi:hypothetical protein J3F84DRAFT_399556 [Trichoderma pleuroticola]
MAEPKPPSRERQRQAAQIARDNRTIFTQIRAFFRAPATIDSLLIMNVISKLFMVTAVAFIWARTRPLGSFGRNVLAFLTVSDIGITQLLWAFNDMQSWRFDPPQIDVAIQTEPENIKMTRVVVEREAAAAALPNLEFVGVRSLRAIEERNRRPRAAVQSDAPPALPSFEFERARRRPVEQSNLHPKVDEETRVSKAVPRVSFKLPVVTPEITVTPPDAEGGADVASLLPSYDSETTPTPPDTEKSEGAPSVSSIKSDESTEIPEVAEERDSASEPALMSAIAVTISKVAKGIEYIAGPSLKSDASTARPEAAEGKDSAPEPSLKSSTAPMILEFAEEIDSALGPSLNFDTTVTIQEVAEETVSPSEPSLNPGIAVTIPDAAEETASASEPALESGIAVITPEVAEETAPASEPALKSGVVTTVSEVAEVETPVSEPSLKSGIATTLPEVTGEKYSALEPALKSGIAATLQKIGEKKAAASLLSQKFETVVTEQEVEEESPRSGRNVRNFWGKVKGLKKSSGRRQSNGRNHGNAQNQGSSWNHGRGWTHVNDSGGQSDSNHDWDVIREDAHPLKDDTPKDSSGD